MNAPPPLLVAEQREETWVLHHILLYSWHTTCLPPAGGSAVHLTSFTRERRARFHHSIDRRCLDTGGIGRGGGNQLLVLVVGDPTRLERACWQTNDSDAHSKQPVSSVCVIYIPISRLPSWTKHTWAKDTIPPYNLWGWVLLTKKTHMTWSGKVSVSVGGYLSGSNRGKDKSLVLNVSQGSALSMPHLGLCDGSLCRHPYLRWWQEFYVEKILDSVA